MSDPEEAGDRPRGILSKTDRKYLRETEEFSRQNAYVRRSRINERVINALQDFSALVEHFDRVNHQRLTEQVQDEVDHSDLTAAIELLYRLWNDQEGFEGAVGGGITQALEKERAGEWYAGVTIDPERLPPRDPMELVRLLEDEKFDELEPVDRHYILKKALEHDAIDFDVARGETRLK